MLLLDFPDDGRQALKSRPCPINPSASGLIRGEKVSAASQPAKPPPATCHPVHGPVTFIQYRVICGHAKPPLWRGNSAILPPPAASKSATVLPNERLPIPDPRAVASR